MQGMVLIGPALAVSAILAWSGDAFAQSTETVGATTSTSPESTPPPTYDRLEEIVVTAQKRGENLQRVPITISTVTASALEARGVSTTQDLAAITPGLSFPLTAGVPSPRIRGVGTAISQAGNENAVATYVDGVYYASSSSQLLSFNNIRQVEIIRGPQGTLFGRNATGGVVQIQTLDPSFDASGNVQVGYGNNNTIHAAGYLTGPIAAGLASDIAVLYDNQQDGYGTNLFNGKDVGNARAFSVRSKSQLEIGLLTSATLVLDYSKTNSNIPAFRPTIGTVSASTGIPFAGGKFDVDSDVQPAMRRYDYGVALTVRHEASFADLVSISAYRFASNFRRNDSDATTRRSIDNQSRINDKQITQELQLVSNDGGPLNWVAGLFYIRGKSAYVLSRTIVPDVSVTDRLTNQNLESGAAFAQATYAIDDRTSLTGGLRYTIEKKTFGGAQERLILATNVTTKFAPVADSVVVRKPTWRAAIDHRFSDDVLGYASYSRGFKSGGYSPTQATVVVEFDPEVLDAYEVGIKSELFDRRVRLNGAGFYYNYRNVQLTRFDQNSLSVIFNGSKAELYGADVDLEARVTKAFTVNASVSYVHSSAGDFLISPSAASLAGSTIPRTTQISAKGNQLPVSPELTFSLGGTYKIGIGENSLLLTGNYYHSSSWFGDIDNRQQQPAYSLVNGSVTMLIGSAEKYSIRAWGSNLTNKAYATQFFTAGGSDNASYAPGRSFGVTLGAKF